MVISYPCSISTFPSLRLLTRAMSQTPRLPKRFAPLDPRRSGEDGAPRLKGIVFDVDGTLWCVCFAVVAWIVVDLIGSLRCLYFIFSFSCISCHQRKEEMFFCSPLKRPLERKNDMPFLDNLSSYDYSIPSPAAQNPF